MGKWLDLSIFERFNFEYQPVGVKFSLTKPDGLARLDKKAAFCQMLKEAQDGRPFYTTKEEHECKVGPILLGMDKPDPVFESGMIGPKLGVYEDARANRRIYAKMPRLAEGSVNFVAFAPLNQLSFDPDLLIITARPGQAEIVLRAVGYKTGAGWTARGTTVAGCAWLYMYPYVHGEVNLMVTGLHHGMKARRLFPEGLLLLSLPFDVLPDVVDSLTIMEWDLPQYHSTREEHAARMKRIAGEVKSELEK
jgi:uncharacterized protein (DUF169 family)